MAGAEKEAQPIIFKAMSRSSSSTSGLKSTLDVTSNQNLSLSLALDKPKPKQSKKPETKAVGGDAVLRSGNLTMGQVNAIFQKEVIKGKEGTDQIVGKQGENDYIGRTFGSVVAFSRDGRALNPTLKRSIQDFIKGKGDDHAEDEDFKGNASKFDIQVSDNIVLLLVSADSVENIGTQYEMAADSRGSTHWTVLNLMRGDDNEIAIRYSDSLHPDLVGKKDQIPDSIKKVLIECGIDPDESQKPFNTVKQKGARCGYSAVGHGLEMLGIPVLDHNKFAQEQEQFLLEELADAVPENKREKKRDENSGNPDKGNSGSDSSSGTSSGSGDKGGVGSQGKKSQSKKSSYALDEDDSSDEDITEDAVERYDLEAAWERFLRRNPKYAYDESMRLVFLAHACGKAMLVSDDVNKAYYGDSEFQGLKPKYLYNQDKEGSSFDVVSRKLDIVLNDLAALFLPGIESDQVEGFIEQIKSDIEESGEDLEDMDTVIGLAARSLVGIVDRYSEELDSDKGYPVQNASWNLLAMNMTALVVEAFAEAGLIQENTTSTSDQSPHKVAPKVAGKGWDKRVSKALSGFKIPETITYLKELATRGGTNFEALLKDEAAIAAYLNDILQNKALLWEFITEVLKNRVDERMTLRSRSLVTDPVENPADVFARMRLLHRSMIREHSNVEGAPDSKEDVTGKDSTSYLQTVWSVGDSYATEASGISKKGLSRKSYITILDPKTSGKYSSISQTIEDTIFNLGRKYPTLSEPITGATVAHYVRLKMHGQKLDLPKSISRQDAQALDHLTNDIFHLMVTCEGERNPAAIIHFQMMLDLIVAGQATWKECINNATKGEEETKDKGDDSDEEVEERKSKSSSSKSSLSRKRSIDFDQFPLMPMAIKGAVAAARTANRMFDRFMPMSHEYHGADNPEVMKELLQREAEITRRWLKLKGIGPEFAKEAMVKACQDWFGIGIQNVVYRPDRKAAEVERLSQHFIGGDGRIDNGLFRTFQEIGQEELLNEALVKEFRDKDEEKKSSEEKESGSGSKKPSLSQGKSQDSDVQMSRSSSASQATSPGTSIQQPRGATHVQSGLNAQSASAKRIRLEKEPDNSGDRGRGRG